MLDQHLTRPEEEPEEEEAVAEHIVTVLVALHGLETARKYMCQFDTENSIAVMGNEVENELYRLRAWGKKETKDSLLSG
jgi:hypothetical protein